MKTMIRCPACGRRRKPSHEARVGKEGKVVRTEKDGKEIRCGGAYNKDCQSYGVWKEKYEAQKAEEAKKAEESKKAKEIGDLCHEG